VRYTSRARDVASRSVTERDVI